MNFFLRTRKTSTLSKEKGAKDLGNLARCEHI